MNSEETPIMSKETYDKTLKQLMAAIDISDEYISSYYQLNETIKLLLSGKIKILNK